ncbi:MAG: twin transmembrane helix small protein [Pseudomonadota bacterium]
MATAALYLLIPITLFAVLFVLARGLGHFLGEGEKHRRRSNRMMQWRLGLQALAIVLMMVFVYLMQKGG